MESLLDEPPDNREPLGDQNCAICHGGGWVHPRKNNKQPDLSRAVPCACRKAKIEAEKQKRYQKLCRLPDDTADMDLTKFRVSNGRKRYDCLVEARALAMQIAEGTGDIRWLTLMAEVDRGKSYLTKCICKRWIERGQSACYITVPNLLDELREGYKREGDQSYYQLCELYNQISLLALDDLGMEYHKKSSDESNDWAMEQLEKIINNRYENERYLIVTTNKPMDLLSIRIASRIQRYQKSRIVVLDSPEYRTWSAQNA